MSTQKLTHEILSAAIEGFEGQKKRIDDQIRELRAMLSGGPAETPTTQEPPTVKRRKMSAAGRRAIAEGQRKRWAASKTATAKAPPKKTPAKKRMSPARKAALIANLAKARAARAAKRSAA